MILPLDHNSGLILNLYFLLGTIGELIRGLIAYDGSVFGWFYIVLVIC